MPAEFDEEGQYKPESGDFDDTMSKPQGSLVINPKTIRGMEDYKPGDTMVLKVKVRYSQPDSEGMSEMEILTASAEEMAEGPRMNRMRERAGMY